MISMARIFGAPETVPAGKQATQGVEPVATLGQPALDARDEVHDVRVALDGHELRHPHGAGVAHAADVVAAEVDQHDVLGALLLVALQLLAEPEVLLRGGAARARAGDRVRLDLAVLDAHQHLGRRADDRDVADAR